MGDKSPKNARKANKQRADARTVKANKKRDAETPGVQPLVPGDELRRISVSGQRLFV
jgi:hypothetical protein